VSWIDVKREAVSGNKLAVASTMDNLLDVSREDGTSPDRGARKK
jgi:hypothetical protein